MKNFNEETQELKNFQFLQDAKEENEYINENNLATMEFNFQQFIKQNSRNFGQNKNTTQNNSSDGLEIPEAIKIEQKLPPVEKVEEFIQCQNNFEKQSSIPTEAGYENYNKHNQIKGQLSQISEQTNDYSQSQISKQITLNRSGSFKDDDFQTMMIKIDLQKTQEFNSIAEKMEKEVKKEYMTGEVKIPEKLNDFTSTQNSESQSEAQRMNLEKLLKEHISKIITENSQFQSQNNQVQIDQIYQETLEFIQNKITNKQQPMQQQIEQLQIDSQDVLNIENVANQELVKFCIKCNKIQDQLEADRQANRINVQEDHPIIFASPAHLESDQFQRMFVNSNMQQQEIHKSQPEPQNIVIQQNIAASEHQVVIEDAKILDQPYSEKLKQQIEQYRMLKGQIERGEDIEFNGKNFSQTARRYANIKRQIDDFLNNPN